MAMTCSITLLMPTCLENLPPEVSDSGYCPLILQRECHYQHTKILLSPQVFCITLSLPIRFPDPFQEVNYITNYSMMEDFPSTLLCLLPSPCSLFSLFNCNLIYFGVSPHPFGAGHSAVSSSVTVFKIDSDYFLSRD